MALPPFMNAHGLVTKIFDKIIEASQPERFTLDYLANKLGFTSGSARPVIPLLKKLGFIGSNGTPTPALRQISQSREPRRGDGRGPAQRLQGPL